MGTGTGGQQNSGAIEKSFIQPDECHAQQSARGAGLQPAIQPEP